MRPFPHKPLALCALLAVSLCATGASAKIATVDIHKLEEQSNIYQTLNEGLSDFHEALARQVEARRRFSALVPADAERAADIALRRLGGGPSITPEEDEELAAYDEQQKAMSAEYSDLLRGGGLSDEQNARFELLVRAKQDNAAAIKALSDQLQERLNNTVDAVRDELQRRQTLAVGEASEAVGATACIRKAMEFRQLMDGQIVTVRIDFLHWGGVDITDDVIKSLDEVEIDIEALGMDAPAEPAETDDQASANYEAYAAVAVVADPPEVLLEADADEDGCDYMRLSHSIATALPLVVATLATAAQGQTIAYMNFYEVQRQAAPFEAMGDELGALEAKLMDEYQQRAPFVYLEENELNRAVELRLKQLEQELSPEEKEELRSLTVTNTERENECSVLIQKGDATPEEEERMSYLMQLRRQRTADLEEFLKKQYETREALAGELRDKVRDQLQAAVERACREVGASICIQEYIGIQEPNADGSYTPTSLKLVQWGGVSVTEAVIGILNESAAPAPAGGGE